MRATVSLPDGRWLAVALLLAYYMVLGLARPAGELAERWRRAGVYAHPLPFVDLQVFPAARATVEDGGELYGASSTDPFKRPYNYPRVWLTFMRFPASDNWIRLLGCSLAAGAVAAVLLFWGRLSAREGLFGGALLCSPAFQLGVERGNTDLAMLALLAGGVLLTNGGKRWRLAATLWWTAAILKLYPVLAFGAWFGGSARAWLNKCWLPLALFVIYLALTWLDLPSILGNTSTGWVQSYGCAVPAMTLAQVRAFHGVEEAGGSGLLWIGRLFAAGGVGWMLLRGRNRSGRQVDPALDMTAAAHHAQLGFRIGALIYIATFLAGSSFDYRQSFLLLTLPQLFIWRRADGMLPKLALVALFFSMGTNYLLAGWPGFFLNEAAGWILLLVLAALLAGTWRPAPTAP